MWQLSSRHPRIPVSTVSNQKANLAWLSSTHVYGGPFEDSDPQSKSCQLDSVEWYVAVLLRGQMKREYTCVRVPMVSGLAYVDIGLATDPRVPFVRLQIPVAACER